MKKMSVNYLTSRDPPELAKILNGLTDAVLEAENKMDPGHWIALRDAEKSNLELRMLDRVLPANDSEKSLMVNRIVYFQAWLKFIREWKVEHDC